MEFNQSSCPIVVVIGGGLFRCPGVAVVSVQLVVVVVFVHVVVVVIVIVR